MKATVVQNSPRYTANANPPVPTERSSAMSSPTGTERTAVSMITAEVKGTILCPFLSSFVVRTM